MKVGICTLGCKVNTYESEYFREQLLKHGYTIASFDDVCDVYIVHTCTVTNTSDVKSRKMLHRCKKLNKDACVVAVGCFVEANPDYKEDGIDLYIGNNRKSSLVSLLDEYFKNHEKKHIVGDEKIAFDDMFIENFADRARAFVKIQDGCENFCSYCIIPYVRGKCRSKEKETTLKEIKSLLEKGYREVVLTGIHTGNYGVDLDTDFASLLQEIVALEGLTRLRISSIEVTELTSEVLEVLKNSNVIVSHLHIPLQAGSDAVLKEMNRKYDLAFFERKLKEIRKIRPDIAITTDIIVGFPGESEEQFQETLKTAERFAFAKIHVFPYSPREGTVASKRGDQVLPTIKKERARCLLSLSHKLEKTYNEQFIGQTLEVLVEEVKEGFSFGHTSNYLRVKINGTYEVNQLVDVTIESYDSFSCLGTALEVGTCQK